MRCSVLFQFIFALCLRVGGSFTPFVQPGQPSRTFGTQIVSDSVSASRNLLRLSSRKSTLDVSSSKRTQKGSSLSCQSKSSKDDNRIRKPFSGLLRKMGTLGSAKRISMATFAVVALTMLLPAAAHATLSSTALSATAASTMMRTPSTPTSAVPSLHPWQWMVVAMMWMLQSSQLFHTLLPLLMNGISQSATWYMMQLTTNPVVTKSITAGVIGVMGDCMAQGLENWMRARQQQKQQLQTVQIAKKYDHRRGLSILLDGLFISGPLMHFGYELFDHVLPIHSGGSGAAILHVLADSVFLDAIFVASTFVVTGRMEGYRFRQIVPQLRKDYLPALKASWATSVFLMPIEFVCFRFLPLSYRVLAVNFIDVIWDAVISFMAHRSRHDDVNHHHQVEEVSSSEHVNMSVDTSVVY